MAQVTLFPSSTKPINFAEATSANVHQGVLYFRAKREPGSESQSTFQTNIPFLLIEED
jgi:hypothetical protein